MSKNTEEIEVDVKPKEVIEPEPETLYESENKVEEIKGEEDVEVKEEVLTPTNKQSFGQIHQSPILNQLERSIDLRMANTMKLIMNVYASMRQYKNAAKFEKGA